MRGPAAGGTRTARSRSCTAAGTRSTSTSPGTASAWSPAGPRRCRARCVSGAGILYPQLARPAGAYLRGGVLHLDGRPLRGGPGGATCTSLRWIQGPPARRARPCTWSSPPAAVVGLVAPRAGLTGAAPDAARPAARPRSSAAGDGLTPLGDDLVLRLAGHAPAAGSPPRPPTGPCGSWRPRTTALSADAARLRAARRGAARSSRRTSPRAGRPPEPAAAAALLAVGHTSGAGLLHGARSPSPTRPCPPGAGRLPPASTAHRPPRPAARRAAAGRLRRLGDAAAGQPRGAGPDGVRAAQVAMATGLNLEVLPRWASSVPPAATPNDLVVALRARDAAVARRRAGRAWSAALRDAVRPRPAAARRGSAAHHGDRAARSAPGGAGPGLRARALARSSRRWTRSTPGRDVMVFCDNVPVDQEVALKRRRRAAGPAGDGAGLRHRRRRRASASASPTWCGPGRSGLVAASGTGCQQLLSLLDHAGVGVSLCLGVGGRDLSAEVGGLSTRRRCAGSTPTPRSS